MNPPAGQKIDYLRLSVTDRCNFRCVYCMPPEGVDFKPHEQILSYEDMVFFVETVDDEELRRRMVAVLKNHDHYPIHYIMHLMHGSEIIGYKCPAPEAVFWRWFYEKLAQCFHLNVETEGQLDARLGACEARFAAHAASAYVPDPSTQP